MYLKNYNEWKEANLPKDLKDELLKLNESEIEDSFYRNLDFGTGGLRGVMGVGTNRINVITIKKSTQGYANYLLKHFKDPSVAISYDNRNNSKEFAHVAAKVLAANGIKSYITPKLRPTPFLSFLTRHFKTSGGIMITASHNPKQYNGYKVYEPHGGQLNLENSELVIESINQVTDLFNIKEVDNELINWVDLETLDTIYLEKVKTIQLVDYKEKATIVYSPLHGTGGQLIPRVLSEVGYDYHSFSPHMITDGNFPNTRSANPEEKVAYIDPIEFAKEINADIIILTDPDADRIGAAVKHENDYTVINGNQLAVLTLNYILENTKDIKDGYVYMSNVTSSLVEVLANHHNLTVEKTLPGFKFIAEKIENMPKDATYVFGCEESNGNIINDFVRDKDAVQASLMLAEIASYLKKEKLSIIDYLNKIYEKFGYFIEETISYEFVGLQGVSQMNKLMDYFRDEKVLIPNKQLTLMEDVLVGTVSDYTNNKEYQSEFAKSNVIRFEYNDGSWIMARPSGTEPKLKIYYSTVADTYEKSRKQLEIHQEIVNKIIKNFN